MPTAGNKNALAKLAIGNSSGKADELKEMAEGVSHNRIALLALSYTANSS
jgi:hypothetical protein